MEIQVRDAETHEPIPGARVSVWQTALHSNANSGVTGADGTVRIPAPPREDSLRVLMYEVAAKGYLIRQTDHPAGASANGVTLEVFAEPRPVVALIVPTGFKGIVRGTYRVESDLPLTLHQREFSFPVAADGSVAVVVPPIFARGVIPDIQSRYADGTPLSRSAKDYDVGCRWLEADADTGFIFVIGTQYEADEMRRAIKARSGSGPRLGPTRPLGLGNGN